MNDFDFIDYKKPIGEQYDYRTSTYLGHRKLSDIHPPPKWPIKERVDNCKIYKEKEGLPENDVTEQRENYGIKMPDINTVKNPTLSCNATKYMKPFEEDKLLLPPTPMNFNESVYKDDFKIRPRDYAEPIPKMNFLSPISSTKIVIDRTKPGYAKYLDPAATTSNLTYINHSLDGIAAKDNITFWTWSKKKGYDVWPRHDRPMCNKVSAKNCPRRRYEYRSMVKPVPFYGMTTETRDNFQSPLSKPTEKGSSKLLEDTLRFYPIDPFAKKTEYHLYGSRERVQKYVNIDGEN